MFADELDTMDRQIRGWRRSDATQRRTGLRPTVNVFREDDPADAHLRRIGTTNRRQYQATLRLEDLSA